MNIHPTCECESLSQRFEREGKELRDAIFNPTWLIPNCNLGLNAQEEAAAIESIKWEEKRNLWLSDKGLRERDVTEDEDGEYVIVGYEQEDCSSIDKKFYLPTELQYLTQPF